MHHREGEDEGRPPQLQRVQRRGGSDKVQHSFHRTLWGRMCRHASLSIPRDTKFYVFSYDDPDRSNI